MIHFFNKVYLVHESYFTDVVEHIVLLSKPGKHPLHKYQKIELGTMPSMPDMLATNFEGSREKFWKAMLEKDPQKRFDIYADTDVLISLLLSLWKSIFPNHTIESLYKLFTMTVLDHRLKSFISYEKVKGASDQLRLNLKYMAFDEFKRYYEMAEVSATLGAASKDGISFEFLLAEHFGNPLSPYRAAFKTKLRTLAWKAWFNDAEILKAEILNSFYDVRKLVPSAQITFDSLIDVEGLILREPHLRWILDERFNDENIDYVKAAYGKEIFLQLHENMHRNWGVDEETLSQMGKSQFLATDQIMQTELVFDEKHEQYLEDNIKKGFGCIFTNDHLQKKSNQLFPCFVYECVRDNKLEQLKPYLLS